MKIAIGSDHRGLDLKAAIMDMLAQEGYECRDCGAYTEESVDYPDIAAEAARAVLEGDCMYGILICGTGIGMSIAANKVNGIRAALCHDLLDAHRAKGHNNANIICLRGEIDDYGPTLDIVRAFLKSSFEGGRHQRRLDKIHEMEKC